MMTLSGLDVKTWPIVNLYKLHRPFLQELEPMGPTFRNYIVCELLILRNYRLGNFYFFGKRRSGTIRNYNMRPTFIGIWGPPLGTI